MKTSFPLFARLLLWFFVNLSILVAGLVLMVRLQFGSLDNWLMPESSRAQIQALSADLIDHFAHSDQSEWGKELARLSTVYKMDFALFDSHGQRVAGATLRPPREIMQAMRFAQPDHHRPDGPPPDRPPRGLDRPPLGPPGEGMSPPEGAPDPDPSPGNPPPDGKIPDFPKSVLRSEEPPAYWLLIRLPPEPLHATEPFTLVGMTPSLGISPLLFNPKPWLGVGAGIIVFSILFWIPLARNLTNSIVKMTRATESIAEGRFDIQLADSRRDELGRLSHAINRMAGRLKNFVTGQKRFLGDAAHELCSPLARMEIALGILEERGDEASRPYIRDVREEVTHMRKLTNELLSFSKASMGESHIKLESVNVGEIVDAAIRLEKSPGCAMEVNIPGDMNVRGHFELLHRALANLLRNAIRYAGDAGPVSIDARQEEKHVIITVSDHGPGVSSRELEKLFDPFYRIDSSRASETGGAGLGLAIVKSCVEACGGVVSATNRTPNGLQVQIRLNRAEA